MSQAANRFDWLWLWCRDSGSPEPALADFEAAPALWRPAFICERVRPLLAKGDAEAALNALNEGIGYFPKDAELRGLRGEIHRAAGRWRSAIADLDVVLRQEPGNAAAWMARGRAHLSLDKPYLALGDFKRALRLNPADPLALTFRGNAKMHMANPEAAFADYAQALIHDPKCFEALFYRAALAMHLGQIQAALEDYDCLLNINPGNAWLWGARARLHFIRGDFQRAAADFDAAEASTGDDLDMRIWSYFAHRRAHDIGILSLPDPEGWPGIMMRHVLGVATADQIRDLATEVEITKGDGDAQTQAAFYLAESACCAGNRQDAAALFAEAAELAVGSGNSAIRSAALAELAREAPLYLGHDHDRLATRVQAGGAGVLLANPVGALENPFTG
ncbi:hypothetical protein WCLP8_5230006 [uncultured Gammaproteobacteria bacterium]